MGFVSPGRFKEEKIMYSYVPLSFFLPGVFIQLDGELIRACSVTEHHREEWRISRSLFFEGSFNSLYIFFIAGKIK